MKKAIILVVVLFFPFTAHSRDFLKYFTFSEKSVLNLWKEKLYKGKVDYRIITQNNESFVQAKSDKAASGIYYEFADGERYNPTSRPYISWKWKINKFPTKTSEERKDDFAARIYVIFPAKIFIFSKCIEYIWDDIEEEGTIRKSPLSSRIQMFVLRKGLKPNWIFEERNVVQDYMKAFGETEVDDEIGALAFMSDTDDTESQAGALFDEMKIGYEKPIQKK